MKERMINNNIINRIESLSKLSLSEEERVKSMGEMDKIIEYVSRLNEVDTEGIEPLVNVLPISNVIREDEVVVNEDTVKRTIANGPMIKDNMFVVPKTV